MRPERVLLPLLAVVLAVFGTSHVMESVDPGPLRASGFSGSGNNGDSGGGNKKGGGKSKGDRKERSRESHSFFSPTGMRELVDLIRHEAGPEGRITLFRVQANQAQVFVKRSATSGGMLVIDRGPNVKFSTTSPASPPGGFSPRKIDPRAPERIGDAIARMSDASLSDVDYMVFLINPVTGEGSWESFLATGDHTHFHADAHGRGVTRP